MARKTNRQKSIEKTADYIAFEIELKINGEGVSSVDYEEFTSWVCYICGVDMGVVIEALKLESSHSDRIKFTSSWCDDDCSDDLPF